MDKSPTVPESGTVHGHNRTRIGNGSSLLSKDLISDSDQRGAQSASKGGAILTYGGALEHLLVQGMPESFLDQNQPRDLKRDQDKAVVQTWVRDEFTEVELFTACQRALDAGGTIGPKYIDAVLRKARRDSSKQRKPWPRTDDEWIRTGSDLGVHAQRGELMDGFKSRVRDAMNRAGGAG